MSTTSSTTQNRPIYPIGVPDKFTAEGQVQRYPGNTVICHIPTNSRLQPGLQAIYDVLNSSAATELKIYLLPPSSWHMTVLDGVREQECDPNMWPGGMENPALATCTRDFSIRLKQLGRDLGALGLAPPYRMKIRGFDACVVGVGLEVEGATPEEEKRMRRLRDILADTLGFRAPNHQSYGFHISLAYLLRHLDEVVREEVLGALAKRLPLVQLEFELYAVEFCTFEDMCVYTRLFYLE